MSCLIPVDSRASRPSSELVAAGFRCPRRPGRSRGDDRPEEDADEADEHDVVQADARGTGDAATGEASTAGRIAAARMKAKSSATASRSCQSARAATTIPPTTRVESAARFAVCFTARSLPARAEPHASSRLPPALDEHTFAR